MFGYEFEVGGETSTKEQQETNNSPLESSWFSGFSGLIDVVKDTAQQAVNIIKEDLIEIADAGQELAQSSGLSTVKYENIEAGLEELDQALGNFEKIAVTGISKLKDGLTDGISSLFVTESPQQLKNVTSRTDALIHAAGADRNTYLRPFENEMTRERFEKFKLDFDQVLFAGRISVLIDSQPEIPKLKNELGINY